MYWQVDGDQLNVMNDNQTDWPHKEAAVDVSGWMWRGDGGTGPYVLNFIGKDLNGNTLVVTTSTIHVAH